METLVNIDFSPNQNSLVPRLTYNRAFVVKDELAGYADDKDGILDSLNDAIAADPTTILENIAWLQVRLDGDEPIETRPFVAIKENRSDDGWSQQRPYIGLIRDVLSITNNGSQFEFGNTPQKSDGGWAIVFDKCNDIDRQEIIDAQNRVIKTQAMVRKARNDEANNSSTDSEVQLAYWEQQNTVAKQQRALIRLRSLAVIARGELTEVRAQAAAEPEQLQATASVGAVRRASALFMRFSAMVSFT